MRVPITARTVTAAAVAIAVLAAGCTSSKKSADSNADAASMQAGPISVAVADPTGVFKTLTATWNSTHAAEQVTLTPLPADAASRRDSLVEHLQNKAAGYDVVVTDLTSTAEFAAAKWLEPLTGARVVDTSGSVAPVVAAGTYNHALYAAPITAEAGLLYYRSDLLKAAPTSWAALTADCALARSNSLACFSGQYAQGQDLTTNATESMFAAGGHLLAQDGKTAEADTASTRRGLQFLVDAFSKNVIPAAAITYRQEQSVRAFSTGALLMMRGDADSYATISAKTSPVTGHVKVAPLPGPDGLAPAAFRGLGAGITSAGQHQRTALAFVRYLQSVPAQRTMLTAASLPPALRSLYSDATLRAEYPFLGPLQQGWATGRPFTVSPAYQAISDAVADNAYAALTGTKKVAQATKDLQAALAALPLS
jgi:multiple sugar transport system substrate-binding protein